VRINCVSPMLAALQQGVLSYEPEFPGLMLMAEQQDLEASISNLRALVREGRTIANIVSGPAGLLFIFDQGEQYLATGLRLGSREHAEGVAALMAELGLVAKLGFSDVEELAEDCIARKGYRGPLITDYE
jgi:hypothetical protein